MIDTVRLAPGSVLSFSAGSTEPRPDRFRIVTARPDLFQRLVALLGDRAQLFGACPVVVNAYPAVVLPPAEAIFVDAYGRQSAVSSALKMAADRGLSAVAIGMPLLLAQLLHVHLARGARLPSRVVLMSGGYPCPRSLERWLVDALRSRGVAAALIQLYGVAELGSALLASVDRDAKGEAIYRAIDAAWTPVVRDGRLAFRAGEVECITEERAEREGDAFRVRNAPTRVSPDVLSFLESWTAREWSRRTGALVVGQGQALRVQLRPGEVPSSSSEVEFHDFARDEGFDWHEKPRW